MKLNFCVACGIKENLHYHHLIPKIHGGSDEETNLITLCENCHGARKDHVLNQQNKTHSTSLQNCTKCHHGSHSPSFDKEKFWSIIKH